MTRRSGRTILCNFVSMLRTAVIALAALLAASPASAAMVEVGLQVGAIRRQIADTAHAPLFNAQMYGEVSLLRDYLSVGAYLNGVPSGASSAPTRVGGFDVALRTYGVRSRVMLPLTKGLAVYAHVGLGYVDADFPEVSYARCAGCAQQVVPAANRSFAEVPFGVGVRGVLEGPFVVTVEGAYRPTVGYEHAEYDGAYRRIGDPAPTSPATNAWTILFGLGVVL